jgi:hypothetical protein
MSCTRSGLDELPHLPVNPAADDTGVRVRRIGLGQAFFLVDRSGELRDLAELFLSRCWDAAEAEGPGLGAARIERVKSLAEMITPPVVESGGARKGLV